jgi:PTS system nitrogen regulatory IIA component
MKIAEMLKKDYVIESLTTSTKKDALRELAQVILHDHPQYETETVVKVLLDREKLGSTGIGDGIAIPHGKLAMLDRLVVSFGRSPEGIDFNAMDGRPVHLFFSLWHRKIQLGYISRPWPKFPHAQGRQLSPSVDRRGNKRRTL